MGKHAASESGLRDVVSGETFSRRRRGRSAKDAGVLGRALKESDAKAPGGRASSSEAGVVGVSGAKGPAGANEAGIPGVGRRLRSSASADAALAGMPPRVAKPASKGLASLPEAVPSVSGEAAPRRRRGRSAKDAGVLGRALKESDAKVPGGRASSSEAGVVGVSGAKGPAGANEAGIPGVGRRLRSSASADAALAGMPPRVAKPASTVPETVPGIAVEAESHPASTVLAFADTAEAKSADASRAISTDTLVGDIEPIPPIPSRRQKTDEIQPDELLALAFASGVRAAKRQPRRLDPHELERLAAGTVTLPVVAEKDRVPVAPVELEEDAPMLLAESTGDRPRRMARSVAAFGVLVVGAGVAIAGIDHPPASASGSLSASLVGGADQEATVPAALTGSDAAQARSAAQEISAEAATSPMCNTDGASGVRAAYANTKNVLVWPLVPGTYTLTSSFGSRIDPVYHSVRVHAGQDLAGPLGTPVYAAADGVVVETFGTNNMVRIKHEINGETFYTAYLHMYAKDILVTVGDTVTAGQRIGAIGNYGKSTGPHLHFETHDANGDAQEPTAFMKAHGAMQITEMCR